MQPCLALLVERALRLLGALALGHVPQHFRESAQLAVLSVHRREHRVREKARAVFAHAPPFVFEHAALARKLQLALRFPRLHVFRGEEHLERTADHFRRLVTFNALRARVPRRHVTGRIEHEDRVFANGIDEQAEQLLALPQPLLGFATLSQVARDFRESAH